MAELYCTTLYVKRGDTILQAARITWETAKGLYDIDVYQDGSFMRVYPVNPSTQIVNKMERYFATLRPLMESAAFHPIASDLGKDAYWNLHNGVRRINA